MARGMRFFRTIMADAGVQVSTPMLTPHIPETATPRATDLPQGDNQFAVQDRMMTEELSPASMSTIEFGGEDPVSGMTTGYLKNPSPGRPSAKIDSENVAQVLEQAEVSRQVDGSIESVGSYQREYVSVGPGETGVTEQADAKDAWPPDTTVDAGLKPGSFTPAGAVEHAGEGLPPILLQAGAHQSETTVHTQSEINLSASEAPGYDTTSEPKQDASQQSSPSNVVIAQEVDAFATSQDRPIQGPIEPVDEVSLQTEIFDADKRHHPVNGAMHPSPQAAAILPGTVTSPHATLLKSDPNTTAASPDTLYDKIEQAIGSKEALPQEAMQVVSDAVTAAGQTSLTQEHVNAAANLSAKSILEKHQRQTVQEPASVKLPLIKVEPPSVQQKTIHEARPRAEQPVFMPPPVPDAPTPEPQVSIGQIDIIIQAPAPAATKSEPHHGSSLHDLSSRMYLRRL